ncbi:MAG: hypothetical protein IJU51_03635 [Clostridia bacterium]|nr:hypothetical protein [Clostridia bacterium]
MSDDFISCEFPDLDDFIRQLDLMNENVNRALRTAMHEAGAMIAQEQKRCISGEKVGGKLTPYIREGEIFEKGGGLGISSGYQDDAFFTDEDGFNPGVVGMTYEFGRPGSSSNQRRSETITQSRNGRRVKVKKGAIQPVSHIRRGFDNVKDKAAERVISAYNREIDKLGE